MEKRKYVAKKGTNTWKLLKYLERHKSVTSRDSKYRPLEIMDLPKLISDLINKEGLCFEKTQITKVNKYGITKRYTEYKLLSDIELVTI